MNPKQLTILAVLVAVAGGIYLMVNSGTGEPKKHEEAQKVGDNAVENLDVPSIDSVTITKPKQEVTLKKQGSAWVVVERDNYPADATKIRGLLYGIKDMRISENRSMRGSAALKELQLLDPKDAGEGGSGAGTVVKFSGGGDSGTVTFGKQFASSGEPSRFIRTEDGAVHVATTTLYNVETDPPAYLDKSDFFKVKKAKTISIAHEKPEDGYILFRETVASPLALQDPAEDEELDSAKLGSLNSLFGSMNFADYIIGDGAKPETTGLDKGSSAVIETFDGFKYIVKVGNKTDDSKYYLSYEVSGEIEPAPEEPKPTVPDPGNELTEEAKEKDAEAKREWEQKVEEVKKLEEKLAAEEKNAGKIYTVDSWSVQSMLKKRSELLKTEEDKDKAEAAENAGKTGASPTVISEGPDGKKRITATTPPVAVDPKLLEAERKKQEKAVIEKAKKDKDAAAVKEILKEHRAKEREKGEGEGAGDANADGSEDAAPEKTEEAKPEAEDEKPDEGGAGADGESDAGGDG